MSLPKNIRCWIITEGLIGTENQCIGIAEALGLQADIHRLDLKQPWKTLSPWLGFENESSYWTFPPPPYPDLLICSGRKAIAAARILKKKTQGRCFTVFVQNPKVNPAEFDLVVSPEHDGLDGQNVIQTLGAPNRITPEQLSHSGANFPELCALPPQKIGVLIGGNSKHHTMNGKVMNRICDQLEGLDASLMITASRRTGEDNINILKARLAGKENCYIWDGTGDNPYMAILGLANLLFVTNDSASMLSDAATTGKPVYTIPLDGHSKRLSRMHALFQSNGISRPFNGTLEVWSYPRLNDAGKAAKAIVEAFTAHPHDPI